MSAFIHNPIEISEQTTLPALINPNVYKSNVKSTLKSIQSHGSKEDYQAIYFIYNIPGLGKSLKKEIIFNHLDQNSKTSKELFLWK